MQRFVVIIVGTTEVQAPESAKILSVQVSMSKTLSLRMALTSDLHVEGRVKLGGNLSQ